MPRQTLTAQVSNRTAAQVTNFSTVVVADGAQYVHPAGQQKGELLVKGNGGGAGTLSIPAARTIDGMAVQPRVLAVANVANVIYRCGQYGDEYKQADGRVYIDVGGNSLDIAVVVPASV